jgi:hypothetical protein
MEFSNFVTVGNLTYSDIGLTPVEHLQSLNMVLGGQVTVGNVLIDDMIPAAGYNPIGANQFTALTIDSQLALTGRTAASAVTPETNPFPNMLASEAYANNNNGVNTTGETAQPMNINTVGNIGVGALNGLDLLTVNLKTNAVSVVGNTSAGAGAALATGTITFGTTTAGSTANLVVTGANNVTSTSVSTADTDIVALVVNTALFTGVLTAPGASPALQLADTQSVTFTNGGAATGAAILMTGDGTDDGSETMTVNYTLNGVAGSVTAPASTIFTSATGVATAVAALLDAVVGISAPAPAGATVNVAAEPGYAFALSSVTVGGNTTTLAGAMTSGGTINLGSATNAGIAGNELSIIDGSGFGGTLNLGIIAQVDSTNDTAEVLPVDGDMADAGEVRALTFKSGTGLTTATLATANGVTPTLNAGSEWSFDYSNADTGSYLRITPTVTFTAGSTLLLNNVPVQIQGAVSMAHLVDQVGTVAPIVEGVKITGTTTIEVLAGAVLTLTAAQVGAGGQFAGVTFFGAGTVALTGDASNLLSSIGQNIHTAIVDISALTLVPAPAVLPAIADADTFLPLTLTGAQLTFGALPMTGQTVVGSGNIDQIVTGIGADFISGGLLNDTLTGGTGNDTFTVTSGTDAITDLATGDMVVVSATATANASAASGFVATAATVNNGTLVITDTDLTANSTIDMTLATGANGFTLTGGTSNVTGLDTLIGSSKADIINGGNTNQAVAGLSKDTLTGGGGSDKFVFTVGVNSAATLTALTTTPGVDAETITITADAADDNDETLSIVYSVNGIAGGVLVTLATVNATDATAIAVAVATALDAQAVISATSALGVVTITGDNAASVEITSVTRGGTAIQLAGAIGEGTDVAQVTTLTVGGTPTINDFYSVQVALVAGGGTNTNATAASLLTADIATQLSANFDSTLPGPVVATVLDSVLASVVTFTDNAADNGGFSVTTDTTAAFAGSGASDNGANQVTSADVVVDFVSGTDTISFGLVAGTAGGNYVEAAAAANYVAARGAANLAFDGVAVMYYLTSTAADGGLLFFDANLDGNVDGVVVLTGINSANFAATDIVV